MIDHDKGCAECTPSGSGNCTFGCFAEPGARPDWQPTSDRWPCQEPLADWEFDYANCARVMDAAGVPVDAPPDAVEAVALVLRYLNGDHMRGRLDRVRELLGFLHSNDPTFREQHERYFLRALGEPTA